MGRRPAAPRKTASSRAERSDPCPTTSCREVASPAARARNDDRMPWRSVVGQERRQFGLAQAEVDRRQRRPGGDGAILPRRRLWRRRAADPVASAGPGTRGSHSCATVPTAAAARRGRGDQARCAGRSRCADRRHSDRPAAGHHHRCPPCRASSRRTVCTHATNIRLQCILKVAEKIAGVPPPKSLCGTRVGIRPGRRGASRRTRAPPRLPGRRSPRRTGWRRSTARG